MKLLYLGSCQAVIKLGEPYDKPVHREVQVARAFLQLLKVVCFLPRARIECSVSVAPDGLTSERPYRHENACIASLHKQGLLRNKKRTDREGIGVTMDSPNAYVCNSLFGSG